MQAGQQYRAAVSVLSAPLVHGPVCHARVVAATRLGAYLLLEDDTTVLPVLHPDALALPTAVRLGDRDLDLGERLAVEPGAIAARGAMAEIGGGTIRLADVEIRVVRSFRPARVRVHPGAAAFAPHELELLLADLGRGPGLTPERDDEIAGHLLVTVAGGGVVPDLAPHLHRTTALSADLLRAAAQGYAVPVVVAYVDAVVARRQDTVRRLRPLIEAIGHTSGPALLRGIHALHPATVQRDRTFQLEGSATPMQSDDAHYERSVA